VISTPLLPTGSRVIHQRHPKLDNEGTVNMPIVPVQLPDTLIKRLEAYCEVWNRSLSEVITMLLQHATITQFPIAWLEHINPERYAQQLAVEDQERLEQIFTS
jgi:hypothetical protein